VGPALPVSGPPQVEDSGRPRGRQRAAVEVEIEEADIVVHSMGRLRSKGTLVAPGSDRRSARTAAYMHGVAWRGHERRAASGILLL